MKGKILKKINNYTPDFAKKIMSNYIRKKVIGNKYFVETLNKIHEFESLDNIDKKQIHFEELKNILIYSYEHTIYYKKIFDKINFNPYEFNDICEMKKIPIINKEIVLNNFEDLISDENIDYYIAYTGGSTGKPLKILLDTESIYKEKAFVYNYWEKFGYDFNNSRIITFRGLEFKDKLYKYNPIDNQIILNPFKLNEENIETYIEIIHKFNPEFIHGYVSAIYNMCRILNKKKLSLKSNIKCVFFVSENVTNEERIYIEKTLNCKTNIFYGHSERAVFAEFLNNGYVFNDLYTNVDFIKTEEENIYKIACTGLLNKKMPLIRYVPDDSIIIKDNKIQIYGHWDKELLIGKNDEKVSIASINFHNDIFNKIKYYQFEQFKKGEVILNIVEDKKLKEYDKKEILDTINLKLKDVIDVKINLVDDILLTNRGKYKKVIRHIDLI